MKEIYLDILAARMATTPLSDSQRQALRHKGRDLAWFVTIELVMWRSGTVQRRLTLTSYDPEQI
jgi:hypothetical protein